MSRVVIVRTPMIAESFLTSNLPAPDIGTAYLVAVLKKSQHSVKLIDAAGEGLQSYTRIKNSNLYIHGITADEIVKRIPRETDIIGISCMLTNCWIYDKYIIKKIAKNFPNSKIIIGGEHATAAHEYILKRHPEVFAVVVGEGEETLVELIEAIEKKQDLKNVRGIAFRNGELGSVIVTPKRNRIIPSKLPWPDWSESPLEKYFTVNQGINSNSRKSMIMLASRGCPHVCGFCTNENMWQAKWLSRDPVDVINEIKHYIEKYKIEHIDFVDLTILIKKEWMHQFCDLLISERLNITWAIPVGTRTEGLDAPLLQKMRRSGLLRLLYAAESGSEDTLHKIEKKLVLNNFVRVVKDTVKVGVVVKVNYIIGFPGQDYRQLWQSYKMLIRMVFIGVNDLITLAFVPYPATTLYKELKLDYDFSSEDFRIPMNNNIYSPISWSEYYNDAQIKWLMIFFNGSFYGLQYIVRPYRILQSFYRMFISKKPLTNFEAILFNYFKKTERQTIHVEDITVV